MRRERQRAAGTPFNLALIHHGLGETEEAMNQLEKTYEARSPQLIYLQWQQWDDIRSHPRFQDLHRRMRLPDPVAT